MKTYRAKQLPSGSTTSTTATIERISDGQIVLIGVTYMACAKRWAKSMNNQDEMGLYLIKEYEDSL